MPLSSCGKMWQWKTSFPCHSKKRTRNVMLPFTPFCLGGRMNVSQISGALTGSSLIFVSWNELVWRWNGCASSDAFSIRHSSHVPTLGVCLNDRILANGFWQFVRHAHRDGRAAHQKFRELNLRSGRKIDALAGNRREAVRTRRFRRAQQLDSVPGHCHAHGRGENILRRAGKKQPSAG